MNRKKETTLNSSSDNNNRQSVSVEPTTSSNIKNNNNLVTNTDTESELLKSKKLKAKARQQRILALMSNCQQAFLSNPTNKLDAEAFKEATISTTPPTRSNMELIELLQLSSLLSNLIENQ